MRNEQRGRVIETDDGATLWINEHVSDRPDAPTLILCHGGPGLADDFDDLVPLLAPLGRVVVWHQRGAGRSSKKGPFTIDRFVADLDAVRAAVEVERFVLIGHSWGANLGVLYAQRHADRLDELIYISGIGIEWWPDFAAQHKANQQRRLGTRLGARLVALRTRARSPMEKRERRLLYLRSELGDAADTETAERLLAAEERFEVNQRVNADLNAACAALDLADQRRACRSIDVPVHVITGAGDPRPIAALDSMIAALPSVRVTTIAGAGHNPWIERPDDLVNAIVSGQSCPAQLCRRAP